MFTSIDKAIVAIVMAGLYIINTWWGINIGLSEDVVAGIIGALTPMLVWLVPNKKA